MDIIDGYHYAIKIRGDFFKNFWLFFSPHGIFSNFCDHVFIVLDWRFSSDRQILEPNCKKNVDQPLSSKIT